jgi:NADPH:quinone reductase-like Zn-dependent oxidoreductase
MRAIVIKEFGGPEVLAIEERPAPEPRQGHVLIEVKAFGLNHAEIYFRRGLWGEVAEISGIECVGLVRDDSSGRLAPGRTVAAMVGGLGRSLDGSYAELVSVPAANVAPIDSDLSWEVLAAVPESFATAWVSMIGILDVTAGQRVLIRGATSALGLAAVAIAAEAGAHVVATTRRPEREAALKQLGAAEVEIGERRCARMDAVLDIVGTGTVLDSLSALRRGGRACLVGFLGGGDPLTMQPVFEMAGGRHLSVFASAKDLGTPDFPLAEIPFQRIAEKIAAGRYGIRSAAVFSFDEIQEAHRLMETGDAFGKIVVVV